MTTAKGFASQDIRNIVLLGHGGAGKTTLAEALLLRCGVINRLGSIDQGNTVGDFEPEARAHQHSTNSTALFGSFQGKEINILDTPGHPDLVGYALAPLVAVETALIVVDAQKGIEFNTRRLFKVASDMGMARMIVINKMEDNLGGLPALVDQLKEVFGSQLHCLNLPTKTGTDVVDCFDNETGEADFGSVADTYKEMLEAVIEIDDAKVEKYFAGEKIAPAELRECFIKALNTGHVVPILFVSAKNGGGIEDLLHVLVEEGPSPVTGKPRRVRQGEQEIEVPCDADKPFLGHVFKITTDPFVGKLAMVRVLQGKLDGSTNFFCGADRKARKAGHVLKVQGREHPDMEWSQAGDIVALSKIEEIRVDQILHSAGQPEDYTVVTPRYPVPMLSLAVEAKNKNDEVKLGTALIKMAEEDPTFRAGQDSQTREFVVSGLGDLHLRLALEKFTNRFHVDVMSKPPKIAYRETITQKAEGHYRLKKQTGGAGQFAEVYLRIEPLERGQGFEFKSEVVGGTIPTNYIPAVEKGVQDALESGTLAGFPIQDVKVCPYDGKSHPVDSKDIAFRNAGKWAFRDAVSRARPVMLEPVMSVEISVPDAYVGTVTADLKSMRGRVAGVDSLPGGITVVRAVTPLAEIGNYSGQLRGSTGGQGSFVMEFSHYDPVPALVQQKLQAQYKPKEEAE